MRQNLSLYIHIPFCVTKCNYCSFVSMPAKDEIKTRYVNCLKKEIALRGKEFSGGHEVATVYIGGGTPSCLPDGLVKTIMQEVYKHFVVKNNAEITIEVNPNTLTKDKVKEYLFAGINRVSMGLQCANNSVLTKMGRLHSAEDFIRCVNLLKEQGMNNISSDLILGYPNQTLEDVKKSVELLLKLNIPHISTYMLSVEDGTPLQDAIVSKKVALPNEELVVKMYDYCTNTLRNANYERYEVSNFAKPGFRSKHNQVYWQRQNYLGLGLASHSYIAPQRFNNSPDIETYINFLENKNQVPVSDVKNLTKEEEKEEFIMLSLRMAEGIDVNNYLQQFNENFVSTKKAKLTELIKNGFLVIDNKTNNIKATDKGFLVLNRIIYELL